MPEAVRLRILRQSLVSLRKDRDAELNQSHSITCPEQYFVTGGLTEQYAIPAILDRGVPSRIAEVPTGIDTPTSKLELVPSCEADSVFTLWKNIWLSTEAAACLKRELKTISSADCDLVCSAHQSGRPPS